MDYKKANMKLWPARAISAALAFIALCGFGGQVQAAPCFLAASDETCVRIDSTGRLYTETINSWYDRVVMYDVNPSRWENGATLSSDQATGDTPYTDPDSVEFNIVFAPLGTYVSASSFIIFTDSFKLRDIVGDVDVSLWLTDEDHNIITDIAGFGNDFVASTSRSINTGDEFEVFSLGGFGYLTETVTWWDYHLAFDFSEDTVFGENAAIELIAPQVFKVCDGSEEGGIEQFMDGPCAFGMDITVGFNDGVVWESASASSVPAPSGLAIFGLALIQLALLRRRRLPLS